MRRSTLALMVALVMMFVLSACNNGVKNAKTNSLYDHGLEVIQLMIEIVQTEEYVDMLAGSSEIKSIVQDIGTGDYAKPRAVYAISVTGEDLASMMNIDSLDNASEGLQMFLAQRLRGSLMTQINGMSGVASLAAASVCSVGKTFVDENATEDFIYLYVYDNAVPVAVTFTIGEGHAVSANGVFVMFDGLPCGSAEEIEAFFSYVDADVVEVFSE